MPWVIISSSKKESTDTGFSIIQCKKKMKWIYMYKETSVVDMLIMWVQNIPRPVQIYW